MKQNTFSIKNDFFLTDGGLETTLIFEQGIELNHFAAFEQINDKHGRQILKNYYKSYLNIAKKYRLNFIMETPTWRANSEWGRKLGYSPDQLKTINKNAVQLMREIIDEEKRDSRKFFVSGCIGPKGDGYSIKNKMLSGEAQNYHAQQIQTFALADADIVTALTMNYTGEAIGIVRSAKSIGIPVVISFTVETDGNLPSGETLQDAIIKVDKATNNYASYFMINCAHPNHFKNIFGGKEDWENRICGIRANASALSHAELDNSEILQAGDKCELAKGYNELHELLPNIRVLGGCCGTDHHHIEEICNSFFEAEIGA